MQDYGGAGNAAVRLHEGLLKVGENSNLFLNNIKKWNANCFLLYKGIQDSIPTKIQFVSPEWEIFSKRINKILKNYPARSEYLEIFTDT
jgi:hypothetical protein